MGQLWLSAAAHFYGIDGINAYSGGTEATAFNANAVAALEEAGFQIREEKAGANPVYHASMGAALPVLKMFSKRYDHPENPHTDFAALMVCTEADEACPLVSGANGRFAIPYRDPKEFDGTEKEAAAYRERCRQIAREMFFTLKSVSDQAGA